MAGVRGDMATSLRSAGCDEPPTAARYPMEREEPNDLDRARRPLEIHTNSPDNGRVLEREVPVPEGQLPAEEALEIAVESYVYAYPLVVMDVARMASTNTATVDGMRRLSGSVDSSPPA